jgi:hypothetical protein
MKKSPKILKIRILVLILFCSAIAVAQTGQKINRVKVSVVDEAGGGISDTRVTFTGEDGKQISGFTNSNGQLEVEVREGNYSVFTDHTRHREWKKFSLQQFAVSGQSANELRIVLKFNLEGTAGGLLVTADPKPNDKVALTSVLTGTIYDALGNVVPLIKVVAINAEGKTFETFSNEEGIYNLTLPFNKYRAGNFREAKYDIIVGPGSGFRQSVTKGFVFIPSQFGKMQLDIALEIGRIEDIDIVPVITNKLKRHL